MSSEGLKVPDDGQLVGTPVVDGGGEVVGRAARILVDPTSLDARWLAVTLTDGTSAVVPAQAASSDGTGRLVVPYDAATVAAAPRPTGNVVTEGLSARLLRYYGFLA